MIHRLLVYSVTPFEVVSVYFQVAALESTNYYQPSPLSNFYAIICMVMAISGRDYFLDSSETEEEHADHYLYL